MNAKSLDTEIKQAGADNGLTIVEALVPTLMGAIAPDGSVRIVDQPGEVGQRVRAYFGRLQTSLQREKLGRPSFGWVFWSLNAVEFAIDPSIDSAGPVIPRRLQNDWVRDAEGCVRGIAAIASVAREDTPPYSVKSRRFEDEHGCAWQFEASSATVSLMQLVQFAKSLDDYGVLVSSRGVEKNREQSRQNAVVEAGERAKRTIDDVVKNLSNRRFGEACDRFTSAAKSFAALVLGERIRRSFAGCFNAETSEAKEGYPEKIQHSSEVRSWLVPWNLGFADPESTRLFQLYAKPAVKADGRYVLSEIGGNRDSSRPQESSGAFVRRVVETAELQDTTEHVHRRGFSKKNSGKNNEVG